MGAIIKLVKEFSTTHEREFGNEFSKLFKDAFLSKEESYILLGNLTCEGKELDALVLKKDAIIIIDFKESGGIIFIQRKR